MSGAQTVRVLLYGDVNLNVIDGSAIWLPSIAEAWSKAGAVVHVQLKSLETRDLLTAELRAQPGVTVVAATPTASRDSMTPGEAAKALVELDRLHDFDVVMVRGIRACYALARDGSLDGKLWSYVTEYSYGEDLFDQQRIEQISAIAQASRLMFAQTPQARAVLESIVPAAAGRTALLGPMIPDEVRPRPDRQAYTDDRPLRLIYTGKFANAWRTDRMPEIVDELRALGTPAELTMVGDKVHDEPESPEWSTRMRAVMEQRRDDVHWIGGKDRATSLELLGDSDVSLGWRDETLDLSLEISTKVLESCALGVVSVLNRTGAHEQLFGSDYPLFVNARTDTPTDIAAKIQAALPEFEKLSQRVMAVAEPYRVSRRAADLRRSLERLGIRTQQATDVQGTLPAVSARGASPRRKVVLAGHDLKFAGELVDMLRRDPNVELRIDRLPALHKLDEASSREHLEWADVIICEWAGSNAVWYSQRKLPHQKLIVRLHMFELRGRWMPDIDIEQVDLFVAVSELYRRLVIEQLGIPENQVVLIPNAVSVADLDREGLPGREHRLGIVGIVPLRKRLDRAIDLLRELRKADDRFTLHVRGRMPWEYPHEWRNKPEQRESYMDLFARLGGDPIHEAVAFEPFGTDMASWYAKIGWVLSPSTTESFHLAPAEGMVSGGLPVLWDRAGVRDIYGDEFIVADAREAAELILGTLANDELLAQRRERAKAIARNFDEHTVARLWDAALGHS